VDLLQLRYFQVVARLQHMTRAAADLAVAQPSLSRTIARLEQELGVPLFDRQGRQIRLNHFGSAFLECVDRALAQLEDGRREVADLAGLEQGQVTLAATTLRWVPELLNTFRSRHPHVRFRLIQAETAAMRLQLERGESDLCLSGLPIEGPGIHSVPVLTEEIFLAVPSTHRLAERSSIRLGEVADEPFISLKPGYDMRDLTDQFCRQAGFAPQAVCEVDEPAAIRALVRAGLGVAFLPAASWRFVGEPEPVPLHVEAPSCQRILALAWREDRYLSAAARLFRQFMIDYFARLPR
jgi:DNA-binding transcriptional LysR family regulator